MNGKLVALLWLAASAFGLGGCAHEAPEASYPQSAGAGWVVPANYSWPPAAAPASGSSARAPAQHATAIGALTPSASKNAAPASTSVFAKTLGDVPRPRARNELRAVLPGSSDCLARLGEHGVPFRALD
ncbi:MAG TPA: hypothetical protein VGL19_22860, partial [Polyangiaceae bacterium]